MREKIVLSHSKIPINKGRKTDGVKKKSLFGSHYVKDCFRQKSPMTPKPDGESMMKSKILT